MEFWRPDRWLPRDVPWEKIPPNFYDLLYPIYLAAPLVLIRILWESLVGIPLAYICGYYGNSSLWKHVIKHMSGGFARNSRSKRILECFWRFSYYLIAFLYGCYVLSDKSWLWDVKQCWIGYPYHPVDDSIWWYYTVETAFYYSLLLASFFDIKRSDFWQLIIHHFVTIGLLAASWTINFVRVGTLVLISHDVADILLEGGKLVRYDRRFKLATNIMFVIFLFSWIVTRLGYYPFVLIRSGLMDAAGLIQPDYKLWDFTQVPYAPRFIIFLLVILLFLHIFWTFIIFRVVIRTVTQGEAKDVRSDSESDGEDEDEKTQRQKLLRKTRPANNSHNDSDNSDASDSEDNNSSQTRRRRPRRE